MKRKLDYIFNGDDLGTIWLKYNTKSIVKAVVDALDRTAKDYKMVSIQVKKKSFFFFGENSVTIYFEDPIKIKQLQGTQHYHKSMFDDE